MTDNAPDNSKKNTTSRRQFLKAVGKIGAGGYILGAGGYGLSNIWKALTDRDVPFVMPPTGQALPWKNWSGALSCQPAARIAPKDIAELTAAIRESCGGIRPVGSGHSFSGLVPTDGTIVSLSRLTGLVDYDPNTMEATFGAGTRLEDIGEPLRTRAGQALINMPDINQQTLAGAISTGTHGAGAGLQSLSAYVTGFELVTAGGDVFWCDENENPDVFKAGQVSLGALGIVTKIRMQNCEPYLLERRARAMDLDEFLDAQEQLIRENRNVDSFFFPNTDKIAVITYNEVSSDTPIVRLDEETDPLGILSQVEEYLGWAKPLRKTLVNAAFDLMPEEYEVDQSYNIYPSTRSRRFNNMEYELPLESGPVAMREIRDVIYNQGLNVYFPIQYRQVKGDDVWLSPFFGRESCSISVTISHEKDAEAYFNVVEPILQKYDGRPHWGKYHTMTAEQLSQIYPHWQDFLDVRERLDPEGRFLNEHLSQVLGVARPNTLACAPQTANAPKP